MGGLRVTPVSRTLIKLLIMLTFLFFLITFSPTFCFSLLPLIFHYHPSSPPSALCHPLFHCVVSTDPLGMVSLCPTWLSYSKSHCSRWCHVCIGPGLLATPTHSLSKSRAVEELVSCTGWVCHSSPPFCCLFD